MEEKEHDWATRDQAAKELSEGMQNKIRNMEKALDEEKLKTADTLNQRDAAQTELVKMKNKREKVTKGQLEEAAHHAVEDFMGSQEGEDWVNKEMAARVLEPAQEIMGFVDSEHPGIDWRKNPTTKLIVEGEVENQEEEEEGEPKDGDDMVVVDDVQPTGQT